MSISEFALASLPAILIALATAFFSSRFYAFQAKADLQKEFGVKFNEQRWQAYQEFTGIFTEILEGIRKKNLQNKTDKLSSRMNDLSINLLLVGSDDVIKAFAHWKRYSHNVEMGSETDKTKVLPIMMQILIEMRKDLGYETILSPQELLATFISGSDEYFGKK